MSRVKIAARHAQVVALKEQGLTFEQIARNLGLAKSTVTEAYYDPQRIKARARKHRTNGTCVDCGGVTISDGSRAGKRCVPCARVASKVWTREAVVAAIREWADAHGGVPPAATDWNTTLAMARYGKPRPDGYPATVSVQAAFGSWRAAIEAAGFDAFTVGHYGRDGEDPAVIAETAELYRSGLTLKEVAARMGVAWETARNRLVKAGEPRRSRWDYERRAA